MARAITPKPSEATFHRRLARTPYLFLSPYLILVAVFFVYPLCSAVYLAFQQTNGPGSMTYVGWDNFRFILSDGDFRVAVRNTVVYAFFSVFLQMPFSLALALMLNSQKDRLKNVFRLILFSPQLVGSIFVGILFGVLFFPRYGLFNRMLYSLFYWGLEKDWLGNEALIMPALVLCSLWMYVGFNMIYFLAALQSVDQNLQDAARIDGAGRWALFRHVTLPAIKPVATFVVVMSTIGSFQLFELPYALLRSTYGPNNAGLTIVGYLYKNGFDSGDLGLAAAAGWILALIIFLISMAQMQISGTMRRE
jgi:ABC-type sugar transport system permease subunit